MAFILANEDFNEPNMPGCEACEAGEAADAVDCDDDDARVVSMVLVLPPVVLMVGA